MIYFRKIRNGEIKQTLIVHDRLLVYYPGAADVDYSQAQEVATILDMRDIINEFRHCGYYLRNMADVSRVREKKTRKPKRKKYEREKSNIQYLGDEILPFM